MTIDLDKFRATILKEDLGRMNLFKVEFNKIGKSGSDSSKSSGTSIFRSITDAVTKEVMARSEPLRRLSGFYSPEIIRAAGLGTALDTLLGTSSGGADLGMYVKSVGMPGRTLTVVDQFSNQIPFGMVNGGDFEPITMTFITSPTLRERQAFLDWMDKAVTTDKFKFGFYDNYVSNINIRYYNRQGDATAMCEIADAFPIRVGELALSYDSDNELATFEVTFKYKSAVTKDASGSDSDGNVFTQAKHWYEVGKRLITTYKN